MAFGDTIQSAEGTSNIATTVTVNFSAAVAGNLLKVSFGSSFAVTTWTDPSGWTREQDSGTTGNVSGITYSKIAAGGETSVVGTRDHSTGNLRGAFGEFEGPFEASPIDQQAEDVTNLSTVVTSQSSGTTGTTSQADELALACYNSDSAQAIDTGRAYTNSFTEVIFASAVTSGARVSAAIAKKILSATGTVESTFSTTDTGDEMYGNIVTYKKAAAAGGRIFKLAGDGGGLAGESRGLVA